VKNIWTVRVVQAAERYGEQARMAAVIMACEAGRISIGEWSWPGSNRRPLGAITPNRSAPFTALQVTVL